MTDPYYLTTPIYYVNARPHLGHAYTTIMADVACRFNAMRRRETFLLTGTDEHGDKIMKAAAAEGISPKAYADRISGVFRELWPALNIRYSRFIRTTDEGHKQVVRYLLTRIHDAGDIYFSEYEGLYCFGCERFYGERELVDGKCPDHETVPEKIKESNYFFRMGKYQQWLIDHIHANPDFIRPESYRNEILSFLKEPLEDLCISRPKSRLDWGITLPFDDRYVTYVWFDALANYISAIGYPDGEEFKKFWPVAQHLTAKDIIKPHGIYWPIMLKAAGIPVYTHLNVHGFWKIDQSKMSKSLGNVVSPLAMKDVYGLDAFRYFLCREMTFGLDASFSEDALVDRINADLANDIGNLFSRVLAMAIKYGDGTVPAGDPALLPQSELDLRELAGRTVSEYEKQMTEFHTSKALAAVWEFIGAMNRFVDYSAPWVLAKDASRKKALDAVLYTLLEGLRVIAGLVSPVMPDTAGIMARHLGLSSGDEKSAAFDLESLKIWGKLPPGTPLLPPVSLFPRVEKKTPHPAEPEKKPAETVPQISPEIDFDLFLKTDLRVGTVLTAEKIPKSKKLLRLTVDIGETRTIVAGIAERYAPEALVGKQVVIAANLKPVKLMGVESHGMVLAAVTDQQTSVVTVDREVAPGTRLR
ncbi:MAG: methionine--tRNA ligase [Thermodesulfobacteriota bacterium]